MKCSSYTGLPIDGSTNIFINYIMKFNAEVMDTQEFYGAVRLALSSGVSPTSRITLFCIECICLSMSIGSYLVLGMEKNYFISPALQRVLIKCIAC